MFTIPLIGSYICCVNWHLFISSGEHFEFDIQEICGFVRQLKLLNFLCVFVMLASSGAVDEDSFDRSFDQVPIINVSVYDSIF